MRDSYERFFAAGHITKEQFFRFGFEETIYIPADKAKIAWEELKTRIAEDREVYIRGFGRDGAGTDFFRGFYESVLGKKNVLRDPSNNEHPRRVITSLTGYSKRTSIRNYQISHIFGRTKNIYTFTAPWNIAFVPKILDPFTGHEARGALIEEYQGLFHRQAFDRFQPMIEEFNSIVSDLALLQTIKAYIEQTETNGRFSDKKFVSRLETELLKQFAPIYPVK